MADHGDEEIAPDETPGYQPPAQKTVEEILKADAEDESLRKYKEALLGTADVTLLEVCKFSLVTTSLSFKAMICLLCRVI